MRAAQAIPAVTDLINQYADADVAKAITSDLDAFEGAARALGHAAGDLDALARLVQRILARIDDRTADWLIEHADSPGAWFYRQVQDET